VYLFEDCAEFKAPLAAFLARAIRSNFPPLWSGHLRVGLEAKAPPAATGLAMLAPLAAEAGGNEPTHGVWL